MISIKDQNQLLIQIGDKLPEEIVVYAIGGTAMMFLGLKDATKDVDLVFTDKKKEQNLKKRHFLWVTRKLMQPKFMV